MEVSKTTNNQKILFFIFGWISMLCYFTQRWIIGPVIPFLMNDFQIDKATTGLIGSASLWGYMITPIIAGLISDRYGRKYTTLPGIFGFSIFCLIAGLTSNIIPLFIIRFITGISEAFYFISLISFTLELFPERPGFYLTFMSSGSSLGWFTGPTLAGWLLELTGNWRVPFLAAGTISIIAAFMLFKFWPKHVKPSGHKPLFDKSILLPVNLILLAVLSLATAFQIAAEFGYTMWYPSYLKLELGMTAATAGIIAGFFGLGQFIGRPTMGWLSDRLTYRPMGIIGSLTLGICIICLLIFQTMESQIFFSFFGGFIGAASMGALWTFTGLVFASFKGLAIGVMTTIGYTAASLAPILIGYMGDKSTVASGLRNVCAPAAFLAAIAMLATFIIHPSLLKNTKKN